MESGTTRKVAKVRPSTWSKMKELLPRFLQKFLKKNRVTKTERGRCCYRPLQHINQIFLLSLRYSNPLWIYWGFHGIERYHHCSHELSDPERHLPVRNLHCWLRLVPFVTPDHRHQFRLHLMHQQIMISLYPSIQFQPHWMLKP